MSLLKYRRIKKANSEWHIFTGLGDITNEFKNILKEVIQTASEEGLASHLGYGTSRVKCS